MGFTVLEPEVPGGWGARIAADVSTHPPHVQRLHVELDGWLGDDLLESFPCFIVTDRLARVLEQSKLTGFALDAVEITRSPEFDELHPGAVLPAFRWLRISGRAGVDDFGLAADLRLVASPAAISLLRPFAIAHADQSPYAESR